MSGNTTTGEEANSDVQMIEEIGGVRAYRLERDYGVTTVAEVAEMDVDELTEVWSIGEWTAERILESVGELLDEEAVVVVGANGHMGRCAQEEGTRPWLELVKALHSAGVELENPAVTLYTMSNRTGETKYLDGLALSKLLADKKAKPNEFRADVEGVPMEQFYDRYRKTENWKQAFLDRDRELVEMADTVVILDDGMRTGENHDDWWSIDRMCWVADVLDVDVWAEHDRSKWAVSHDDDFEDLSMNEPEPSRGAVDVDTKDVMANADRPGRGAREEIERTIDSFSDWAHVEDVKEEEKREDGRGVGSKSWSV